MFVFAANSLLQQSVHLLQHYCNVMAQCSVEESVCVIMWCLNAKLHHHTIGMHTSFKKQFADPCAQRSCSQHCLINIYLFFFFLIKTKNLSAFGKLLSRKGHSMPTFRACPLFFHWIGFTYGLKKLGNMYPLR